MLIGPKRVLPGRLSVSRTFGDPEAKLELLGGNHKVVIAEPDIKSFKVLPTHDFIVLASDGIYDKLSNKDIMQCVINTVDQSKNSSMIDEICGKAIECIAKNALLRKSLDNVTVVMIAFSHFKTFVKERLAARHERSPITKRQSDLIKTSVDGLIFSKNLRNNNNNNSVSRAIAPKIIASQKIVDTRNKKIQQNRFAITATQISFELPGSKVNTFKKGNHLI